MGEQYFKLKQNLENLGYNNTLPPEAVPLVECLLADLLQTTRSLQHYMDLSKEALMQRDSLMLEAEPYKCDNSKLIQENNHLNKKVMHLQEENLRLSKESKRKIKLLSEELHKKDTTISKLQHDVRDLSLRGLCAETLSSRNKCKKKDCDVNVNRMCICFDKNMSNEKDLIELTKKIQSLEERNEAYSDEITVLKSQVEHRDNEIIRLNMLLEGGRPMKALSRECCNQNVGNNTKKILNTLQEMENANELLKKGLDKALEKQHEAMLRALNLADSNKNLQDEIQKMDSLALKIEKDYNKRLATMTNELDFLQSKLEVLTAKNSGLERELSAKFDTPRADRFQETANIVLKENYVLQREVKDLLELNKSLHDKILSFAQGNNSETEQTKNNQKCPTKDELQILLEGERKRYEKHIIDIHQKLSDTINIFNNHLSKLKENDSNKHKPSYDNSFIRDLHNKLCESEQKILVLKKENDEIKNKVFYQEESSRQNYKDIINQLNAENAELSKENILLSQQLSQYKNSMRYNNVGDNHRQDLQKFKERVNDLTKEINLLRKDKQEYNHRYKEAMELVEKLKRDLVFKQKDIECLEEENCSYKMTSRTGKASSDHLKEECEFLREQLKKMQSDVIKEKTMASQIKNIQLETERSSNEIQNELLCVQKKLNLSKDATDTLEKKCKELQSEIISLKSEKSNLIDNIRKVDQERDKLVIELDHKTESNCVLEQKLKSQTYELNKLESELAELKRKLNLNKVYEHKAADNEAQIVFLNGEILRLTQQLDTAIIENKHLQNSLADTNGALKINKIEYEKSRKEVDGLKAQLQHYVAEIRRIEELLSHKEAERSDMLEHFASLSVEANILENTNHSLESESASKSLQLQTYISKIEDLEAKLLDKDSIIDNQSTRIASLTCKITALENEVKLITEEKSILEQNIACLKQMYNHLQSGNTPMKGIGDTDSELKLYESRIKSLSNVKAKLEAEKNKMNENLITTEKLLSNARREIVDLKLALQDATSETKSLQECVSKFTKKDSQIHETTLTTEELDLPIMLEDTIHEISPEEDDDSLHCHEVHKRFTKYSHSGTW